jgi:hypothetical protein
MQTAATTDLAKQFTKPIQLYRLYGIFRPTALNFMMERQFLLYLLYITLVDIRERAQEKGDQVTYNLSNLMHRMQQGMRASKDGSIQDGMNSSIGIRNMRKINVRGNMDIRKFFKKMIWLLTIIGVFHVIPFREPGIGRRFI